ncbi:RNA polymerase subunit sigma [Finegoldia magna]|uniref:RNA polymerase subunit sigma n=1 Tax=Finegoldia magna TaxID=1260 RepID=A0A2N6STB3_FINMA|nr:sigma-70 family RNA polymerase sigma factor [Finegoldia magna]PMC60310.1 RNA polymerase subunit sigma [Finegoldia magna]
MDKEYYLFVEGKKVVVSKEVYLAYHSELNKEKYQKRRDRLNNCFFFCSYDRDGNFEENLENLEFDVEKIIETKEMIEEVRRAISKLNPVERDLIESLFYKEETIREVASKLNISHPAVIERRNKVLEKLKEMLEDF